MSELVSIVGLYRPAVLAALYNASTFRAGMRTPAGIIASLTPDTMTEEQAEAYIAGQRCSTCGTRALRFDYVNGRVLKVNLAGDGFDPVLFDRDNGAGAAKQAIDALRERKDGEG
jgi:hypothetical protein